MSGGDADGWAAAQATFDPDGLYLALTRFLAGDRTGAEEAFLPFAPAADLLRGAGAEPPPPMPGPLREAVSFVELQAGGLILYASDAPLPVGGLVVSVGEGPSRAVQPMPLVEPAPDGLRRLRASWPGGDPPAAGAPVSVRDGTVEIHAGPLLPAADLPADVRVQFRRFSGDALWFGPESAATAEAVTGPLTLAIRGEAGAVWRRGEPTLDKEGRTLWRLALDGLVRPGLVQDWEVALAAGGTVARGSFLTFADDKDQFWMRAPVQADREVMVTLVRDRPRQATPFAVLLVTRDGLVLAGEPAADPPGFAFRARDNSHRFRLGAGQEPAHLSVRRNDRELFRLAVAAAPPTGGG